MAKVVKAATKVVKKATDVVEDVAKAPVKVAKKTTKAVGKAVKLPKNIAKTASKGVSQIAKTASKGVSQAAKTVSKVGSKIDDVITQPAIGAVKDVAKAIVPKAPVAAPTQPAAATQAADPTVRPKEAVAAEGEEDRRRRRRGRRGTIMTGSRGVLGQAPVGKKKLLGG